MWKLEPFQYEGRRDGTEKTYRMVLTNELQNKLANRQREHREELQQMSTLDSLFWIDIG